MSKAYLGPAFSDSDSEAFLRRRGRAMNSYPGRAAVEGRVAPGWRKVVGRFNGHMEFGHPIKFREGFRPLARSGREDQALWAIDLLSLRRTDRVHPGAYRCFMRTHLDAPVLGPFLLDKQEQPA